MQVGNLLSEIAILEMYENGEPEEAANDGEESAGETEIAPVCDNSSNEFDLEECIILIQKGKVNAQSLQTIWSFFPTAGISLIAIGLHRLRVNTEASVGRPPPSAQSTSTNAIPFSSQEISQFSQADVNMRGRCTSCGFVNGRGKVRCSNCSEILKR